MVDTDSYPGAGTMLVDRLSFTHQGCSYEGQGGFLEWTPERGFNFESRVKLVHGERAHRIDFQAGPYEPERITVHMELPNGVSAVASDVPFVWDVILLGDNRLIVDADRITFEKRREDKALADTWSGRALYAFPRDLLLSRFAPRVTTLPLDAKKTEYVPCISYKGNDGVDFVGYVPEQGVLEIVWSLRRSDWPIECVRAWPQSLAWALALVYSHSIPLLRAKTEFEGTVELEVRRRLEPHNVWFLPSMDLKSPQGLALAQLACYLARSKPYAFVCRNVIRQMVEASRQSTYTAAELLLATIMEAMFRNVYREPVTSTSRTYNVKNKMPDFRDNRLRTEDGDICEHGIDVWQRLRGRNAHTDWLLADDSIKPLTKSDTRIADLRFLGSFYRCAVLALSEASDAARFELQMLRNLLPKDHGAVDPHRENRGQSPIR